MSDKRELTNSNDPDASLPIADIDRSDVKAEAAEKVKGGETYKGWIDIASWSFGATQLSSGTSGSSGGVPAGTSGTVNAAG